MASVWTRRRGGLVAGEEETGKKRTNRALRRRSRLDPTLRSSASLPNGPHSACSVDEVRDQPRPRISVPLSSAIGKLPKTHRRVRPNLKPMLTQMTLAPKVPDRRRVVVANLGLLGVVAHALADVRVAVVAVGRRAVSWAGEVNEEKDLPPDVVGKLEADNEDAFVDLTSAAKGSRRDGQRAI